ncbi:Heterokaryon incompatibility protein (HET) domain containing protein [Hyaloscypha variabilis]
MPLPRTGPLRHSGQGFQILGRPLRPVIAGILKATFSLWLSGSDMPLWFYFSFSCVYWAPFYFGTWLRYQKLDSQEETNEEFKIVEEYTRFWHQFTAFSATMVILGPGRMLAYWIFAGWLALLGLIFVFYLAVWTTSGSTNPVLTVISRIYKGLTVVVYTIHSFVFTLIIDIDSYVGMLKVYVLPWSFRKAGEFTESLLWIVIQKSPVGQYQYQKLSSSTDSEKEWLNRNQIRLLRIPRQWFFFGHLKCSLEMVDLESPPSYEALSYRWGFRINPDQKTGGIERRRIIVNGCSMLIPRSSYELLHARSSIWHARTVWIDAICMNQEDDEEKAFQVPLMRSIYSKAKRVVVWPGDKYDSGMGSDMLLRVLSAYAMSDSLQYEMGGFFADEIDTPGWKALMALLHNLYFTRIWVVQEIAVGSKVQIYHGGRYTNWDIFTFVYMECTHPQRRGLFAGINHNIFDSPVSRDNNDALGGINTICGLHDRYSKKQKARAHIGHLLADCASMHSTDPRDKIFGLNGLLDLPLPQHIIDYKKPEAEVFIETACHVLNRRLDPFSILAYAGIGWRQVPSTLPSWVPNWAEEQVAFSLWDRHHSGPGQSTATHLSPEIEITSSAAGPILSTKGIILDTINKENAPVPLPTSEYKHITRRERSIGMARWYKEAWALALTNDIYSHTSQSRLEAFWRTIVADRNFVDRPAPPSFAQCNTIYEKLSEARLRAMGLDAEAHLASLQADPEVSAVWPEGLEDLSRFLEFQAAIVHATDGRKFCLTREEGYFCLTPQGSRVGDLVCVLFGAPTPFVLRGYTDKNGRFGMEGPLYQLVGECYVHGFMNGFADKKGLTIPSEQVLNIV